MLKFQYCCKVAQKYLTNVKSQSRNSFFSCNLNQTKFYSTSSPHYKKENESAENVRRFNKRGPVFSDNNRNEYQSWVGLNRHSSTESEENLIHLKNDPDNFGSPIEEEVLDEGDILEEKHFTERPPARRKLRTKQYADIIKDYIRKRKIKEAIDVLEVRMIQEDKVKPEAYIYNLLLGACGRVGYTKKAFRLYNDMKKRGLKVMGGTYTALFNACANSPWPLTDGLDRAKHLYNLMIEKGYEPNDTNYNAMIKAFGRSGDLTMAFNLVDEMARKGFVIKDDTINFLLQACITDKEAGFRHALLVWRKVIEKRITPSIYTFNLLLRCVRDCGLGDLETTKDVIKMLVDDRENNIAALPNSQILHLESGESKKVLNYTTDMKNSEQFNESSLEGENKSCDSNDVVSSNFSGSHLDNGVVNHPDPVNISLLRPNLLATTPHLGNIISLSEVKNPEDRLILLGGCQGFLHTMSDYKCTPDIKTFTQLLDSIPSTNAAEKELIIAMKKLNVKPDIDFYNMLIKKKSLRCDYEGAKEVLSSMKKMKYRPDLITYGVLAIGCKTKEEALEHIAEMRRYGYTLNAEILGAMMKQACYHRNYDYIFEIMDLCVREVIPVNKKFLSHLQEFKRKTKQLFDAKEQKRKEKENFRIFKTRYNEWLNEVQIDNTEDEHPWQQYRQSYPEDLNVKYKQKDTARFKARHISKFKVKTSEKHRKND